MAEPPCITALICTWNRANDLAEAVESVLSQETGDQISCEILIVDNNSYDHTPEVAARFQQLWPDRVRYLHERRQGKSHALNLGVQAARGTIYLIMDDDLILDSKTYLRDLVCAFRRFPDVSFIGGKVLPLYRERPPAWLTDRHWAAIAMSDRGGREIVYDRSSPVCLLAAAFRTADVREIGGYRPGLSVDGKRIGGVEDDDLCRRLLESGKRGLYFPSLSLLHKVEPYRIRKKYHRAWHTSRGRSYAAMTPPELAGKRRLFGLPLYLYRAAFGDIARWLMRVATGRLDDAFLYETGLRFFWGFWQERRRQ